MVTKVAVVGATANSYQIVGKLAVGGMAEIYLARASIAGVERYCVLKRILPERSDDAEYVRMFLDEVRLVVQLQHPYIASVYDFGTLGDSCFFTMEYVHGETVRSLARRAREAGRSVPLACVLTIVAMAAGGLHHAHERVSSDGIPLGIVHRDVSPSNLMVTYDGNIKVLDFGVAKAACRAVETNAGTVKGKIGYLSPEQCQPHRARLDRRSDLFSLGIVMWELLTGARLYRKKSDFDAITAIINEPPPWPSLQRPEVPQAVDEIVLRLLAKSPTDRFQTAGEVVDAIEGAAMRVGMILSTSALRRLMGDLFGARAEPWLDLDSTTLPFDRQMFRAQLLTAGPSGEPLVTAEFDLTSLPTLDASSLLEVSGIHDTITSEPPHVHSPAVPTPLPTTRRLHVGSLSRKPASQPPTLVTEDATFADDVPPTTLGPEPSRTPSTVAYRPFRATRSRFAPQLIVIMVCGVIAGALAAWLLARTDAVLHGTQGRAPHHRSVAETRSG